ncbi:MAG: ribosome recycling factor [Candidatus Vogelbacteria bacterium]|nr:ribosome recycling factor [Candidatus Vogelbacteria bacterium]
MVYDFNSVKNKVAEIADWLRSELASIRTGRAAPTLLDGVIINVCSSRTPLKHLAAVTVEDARTLRVSPWDKNQTKDIGAAVTAANLGVSVVPDEIGLRIIFPELTAEGRQRLVKAARAKLEEARVALRQSRDKFWSTVQKAEHDGKISEDEKFRRKDELQKIIDRGNVELETLAAKKEKEILQ